MRKRLTMLLSGVLMVLLAACGGEDEPAGGGGGAGSGPVKFTFIADQTGVGGLYGKGVIDGARFKVDQINKAGGVNGRQLEMEVVDSASEQQQGAAAMTEAARGDNAAVLYSPLSQSALAMAPIAQREQMPLIVSYSQVDEITQTGEYIYRTSTSEGQWYDGMVKYLSENEDMKTMAVWFASDNATAVTNAEKTMPALAEKYGVEIVDTLSVKATDTDFSSTASRIAAKKPDGVAILILGAGVNTAITQLRRAGYDEGLLFGSSALGAGALKPAGENARDTYYPASFIASEESQVEPGVQFLKDYKAATGKEPSAFTAAGNDQILFLAEAIERIDGEVTPEAVKDALAQVAQEGYTGATGDPAYFEERIAVTPGLLVRWDGAKETLAPNQDFPLLETYQPAQ